MSEEKLSLDALAPELRRAVSAMQDKKAVDILLLDVRGLASFTDYFLIASGGSHRQLEAIADEIQKGLKEHQTRPAHVEGYPRGDWILMDYIDFVVHVFTPDSRAYYDLERLWGDAERLAVAS